MSLDEAATFDLRRYDESGASMLPTPPSTHTSRSSSPSLALPVDSTATTETQAKKKKKKKAKKSTKGKDITPSEKAGGKAVENAEDRPPVLCISRNKHWRYISSYHVRTP